MIPTIHVDDREFQSALRDYMREVPGDLADILNRKMFFILKKAKQYTPIASRENIERILGIAGYKVRRSRKTGEYKRGQAVVSGDLVYRLVNAKRGQRGEKGLYGAPMASAARRLIGRRMSGIGTLKRGWSLALRKLAAAVFESYPADKRVKEPSGVKLAHPEWSPVVEATYNLGLAKSTAHQGGEIDPRVVEALSRAFGEEAASMREYVARKMQERAAKYNAA